MALLSLEFRSLLVFHSLMPQRVFSTLKMVLKNRMNASEIVLNKLYKSLKILNEIHGI